LNWKFWKGEKQNPAQAGIAISEGDSVGSRETPVNYRIQYEQLEVVNRAVNMLVDDVSEIPIDVGDKLAGVVPGGKPPAEQATSDNITQVPAFRKKQIYNLLNVQPNQFQDINSFRRLLYMDYLMDGNIFMYFDGSYLYHLPAFNVTIVPDSYNYVKSYEYDNGIQVSYKPHEIIHVKENGNFSIYRGVSRLRPAYRTMVLLAKMRKFQDNFFDNGAVPGLVIKSPNTLSDKVKERMLQTWQTRYRPDAGGRRPIILDGGLEIDAISNINFSEMDFQNSVTALEDIILKAIGIPPLLLDSGNNANIRPNHRLYYLETVVPILRKLIFACERFFGFQLWENITDVQALQPELSDQAQFFSTLVNGGIITPNEARIDLGRPAMTNDPEADELRVPENIAGSAANPSVGGRPSGSSSGKS
jgi:HK97 family phage portal protein